MSNMEIPRLELGIQIFKKNDELNEKKPKYGKLYLKAFVLIDRNLLCFFKGKNENS